MDRKETCLKSTTEIPFKVSIIGYAKEQAPKESKKVTYYTLSISSPTRNWKVKHRYNDFHTLNEKLSVAYHKLPHLPAKTIFSLSAESQIEKRKINLEKYLHELIALENIFFNVYFTEFLKLDQNFPEFVKIKPLVLCNYETIPGLVFNGVVYHHGGEVNYVLQTKGIEKPHVTVHSPKNEQVQSSGGTVYKSVLVGFKFDPNDPVSLFQDKAVNKTFDLKARSLEYFPLAAILIVGFSHGIISIYKEERANKTNDPLLLNVAKFKATSDRVTKTLVNSSRSELYVIARSNKLKIIDMTKWVVKDVVKIGTGPILGMQIEPSLDLGVTSTEDGKVLVLSLSEKPHVKQTIQVTMKGKLSCLDADLDSGRVICATYESGDIFVLDVDFPFTAESEFKTVSLTKGNIKPQVLKFWAKRREVYLGYLDGTIAVYHFTPGSASTQLVIGNIFRIHKESVLGIHFLQELSLVVTAGFDSTLKVWKPPSEWERQVVVPQSLVAKANPNDDLSTIKEEHESFETALMNRKVSGFEGGSAGPNHQALQDLLQQDDD